MSGILSQPCHQLEHLVVHDERAAWALALPLFCIQTSNVVVPSYSAGAVSARSRSNSRAALAAFAGRPVAGAFPRAPIGVKPVATPGDTLHQDDVVQYHRNGHQARQRMPATTVF